MDKEKSYKYKVGSDDSKGYLITAHKKEHKCIMCGAMSKLGNLRSSNKKEKCNSFICSDCIKSFALQYSKSQKTISFNKFIKNKVEWKQKLDKSPNIKCRLCGAVIKLLTWKWHLKHCHKVGESPEFKQFFIKPNADIHIAQKKWYNPNSSSVPCGTKINGGPRVKIVYNSVLSNRKKF